MGRFDQRLAVGALCGIVLALGAALLLRQVGWPGVWHSLREAADGVWHWVRSPAGLYTQAGAAMVFQVAGVLLVAVELWFYGLLGRLKSKVDPVRKELQSTLDLLSKTLGGAETLERDLAEASAIPSEVRNLAAAAFANRSQLRYWELRLRLDDLELSQLWDRGDPRGKTGWFGVVLLFVGIVLSGTTDLFGIGAAS